MDKSRNTLRVGAALSFRWKMPVRSTRSSCPCFITNGSMPKLQCFVFNVGSTTLNCDPHVLPKRQCDRTRKESTWYHTIFDQHCTGKIWVSFLNQLQEVFASVMKRNTVSMLKTQLTSSASIMFESIFGCPSTMSRIPWISCLHVCMMHSTTSVDRKFVVQCLCNRYCRMVCKFSAAWVSSIADHIKKIGPDSSVRQPRFVNLTVAVRKLFVNLAFDPVCVFSPTCL